MVGSPVNNVFTELPRVPCIFQVVDDHIHVQKAYQASKGYFEQVSPMFIVRFSFFCIFILQSIAQSFLQTHRNWTILNDFADTQRKIADKPAFTTVDLKVMLKEVYF